jgi:hypothetical protein
MTPDLHITRSRHPRPDARRVAFCDGGIDASFRDGIDIELSHWIPNRTPAALKADTSTGIALRFVASGAAADIELVVNNHVDTDGMLSVFVLCHPQQALAHRHTLEQAAAMGDFHAWGDADAQHLFQLMALTRQRLEAAQADPQDIYRQVHARVLRALAGERFAETAPGLAALQAAATALDEGRITRQLLAPHLVHYIAPLALADDDALPPIDTPLPTQAVLPPQLRARQDGERLQLLSSPLGDGWRHDLCWPAYAWAETPQRWPAPGLRSTGNSNRHTLQLPALDQACRALAALEGGAGRWAVSAQLTPFAALPGRPFPVVLSCLQGDAPAASTLAPERVAAVLAQALAATVGSD